MKFSQIWTLITLFYISIPEYSYPKKRTTIPTNTINDFSRLNETRIHSLATPKSYEELQEIIKYAQTKNLKIAISGIRHSQGGQAFFPDAIVINLKHLNKILNFDKEKKLITV